MDIADEAQTKIDKALSDGLARLRRQTQIPFSGSCLFCREPVHNRRFCDSACREGFELGIRQARIAGR